MGFFFLGSAVTIETSRSVVISEVTGVSVVDSMVVNSVGASVEFLF